MSTPIGYHTFTYTRDQVHDLVRCWLASKKCNKPIAHTIEMALCIFTVRWENARHAIMTIVSMIERIAELEAEGEYHEHSGDDLDGWIVEALAANG